MILYWTSGQLSSGSQIQPGKREERTLVGGPGFKCRAVTCYSGKVAIVQPVDHRFFLFDPSIALTIIRPQLMRAQCELIPLFWRFTVVSLDEATSYE